MAAKVDTKLPRGFFLNEEALTKIEDISSKRLSIDGEPYDQEYSVHRVDDALITYRRASEVVSSEENSKRNAVKELVYEAKSARGLVKIAFEKDERTSLAIESDDRDTALLLSSDLKEYLKSEVTIFKFARVSSLLNSRVAFPILFMIGIIPAFVFTWWKRTPDLNLANATDSQKLDYLVNNSKITTDLQFLPVYYFVFLMLLPFLMILLGSSRVYPAYTFYWGKEISRYDSAKTLRGRIFWGIIVALVVGLIASKIANRF